MPAIYPEPVRVLMKDMVKVLAANPGQIFTRQQAVGWFAENYPKIKEGTVVAHLVRFSTNAPSRVHYSARPGEEDILFQIDGSHFRLYDPGNDPTPIQSADETSSEQSIPEEEQEPQGSGEFAYEKDLRNYLAKNLGLIEPGLALYEDEGIRGIEFPVGGRFIDLLAVGADGDLVVIELKVSRGYDRVVGQLMRYMAWIDRNLAEPDQNVRGIIAAREISQDLLLACSLLNGVKLFEYELSLTMKQVDVESGELV